MPNTRFSRKPHRWRYMQQYRCGCLFDFAYKKDVAKHCPNHLRDPQGSPIKVPAADMSANA